MAAVEVRDDCAWIEVSGKKYSYRGLTVLYGKDASEGEPVCVAYCPELEVTANADSRRVAKDALQKMVNAFLEELIEAGKLDEVLRRYGFQFVPSKPKKVPSWVVQHPFSPTAESGVLALAH